MRLSASNIAWDIAEEPTIAAILREAGLDRVDIAPGKYFAAPERAGDAEIAAVRELWNARGFAIHGMQSLLFGTTGLNLFEDDDGRMLARLVAICRIAGGLGVRAATFGSPRQRDRSMRSDAETRTIALDFFRRLGDAAAAAGTTVCLEPNPAVYGCNFMTGTDETAAIVTAVDHPAIRLQLDIGALALNGEAPAVTIARHAGLIGHVHASEPGLATLGTAGAPHQAAGAVLRRVRPDLTVAIEMVASPTAPHDVEIAHALDVARRCYGDPA